MLDRRCRIKSGTDGVDENCFNKSNIYVTSQQYFYICFEIRQHMWLSTHFDPTESDESCESWICGPLRCTRHTRKHCLTLLFTAALPSGLYWAMIVTVCPALLRAAAACSCVAFLRLTPFTCNTSCRCGMLQQEGLNSIPEKDYLYNYADLQRKQLEMDGAELIRDDDSFILSCGYKRRGILSFSLPHHLA